MNFTSITLKLIQPDSWVASVASISRVFMLWSMWSWPIRLTGSMSVTISVTITRTELRIFVEILTASRTPGEGSVAFGSGAVSVVSFGVGVLDSDSVSPSPLYWIANNTSPQVIFDEFDTWQISQTTQGLTYVTLSVSHRCIKSILTSMIHVVLPFGPLSIWRHYTFKGTVEGQSSLHRLASALFTTEQSS